MTVMTPAPIDVCPLAIPPSGIEALFQFPFVVINNWFACFCFNVHDALIYVIMCVTDHLGSNGFL